MKTRIYSNLQRGSYIDFKEKVLWEVKENGVLIIMNTNHELLAVFPEGKWEGVMYVND